MIDAIPSKKQSGTKTMLKAMKYRQDEMIDHLHPSNFWQKGKEWFAKKKLDVEKRILPVKAA